MTTLIFSASLAAQPALFQGGVSVRGEVRLSNGSFADSLYAELYDTRSQNVIARSAVTSGRFDFSQVAPGFYTIRVVRAPGDQPLLEESQQISDLPTPALTLVLPAMVEERPPAGPVSVQELRHPIPEKAIHAAREAQRFSQSGDTRKAIMRLEAAIRIAPTYRDAHVNLGVELARAGRLEDAIHEFNEALEIGPPAAAIYTNLAMASAETGHLREAGAAASEALALDPTNSAARRLLAYTSVHEPKAGSAQK